MRFSEEQRQRQREKTGRKTEQQAEPGEGCSLTSDDSFGTDCYITPTSENDFYCSEPPNLLPHLQRKHCFLSSFMTVFPIQSYNNRLQGRLAGKKSSRGS